MGNMENHRKVVGSVFVVVILILVLLNVFPSKLSPSGAKIDENTLLADVITLANTEGLAADSETTHIFPNGFNEWVTIPDDKGRINSGDRVIIIDLTNQRKTDITIPIEVRYVMRLWIHLKERKLPYHIAGIRASIHRSDIIGGASRIIIHEKEFEELYRASYAKGLTGESLVDDLTKSWIKKHNYTRSWVDG